ncbi:hypothetical protein Tco_0236973 [Tanacetum coccineum]
MLCGLVFLQVDVTLPCLYVSLKHALELLDKAHLETCNPTQTLVESESKLGNDEDLEVYHSLTDLAGCPSTLPLSATLVYCDNDNAIYMSGTLVQHQCFVYAVDFMILEDLGSIIDSGLSKVVLGKPFAHTSKLTYDESLGLIRFTLKDDEVVFRMPQRTKELDLVSPFEKDKFEAFFVDSLKHSSWIA